METLIHNFSYYRLTKKLLITTNLITKIPGQSESDDLIRMWQSKDLLLKLYNKINKLLLHKFFRSL